MTRRAGAQACRSWRCARRPWRCRRTCGRSRCSCGCRGVSGRCPRSTDQRFSVGLRRPHAALGDLLHGPDPDVMTETAGHRPRGRSIIAAGPGCGTRRLKNSAPGCGAHSRGQPTTALSGTRAAASERCTGGSSAGRLVSSAVCQARIRAFASAPAAPGPTRSAHGSHPAARPHGP